MVAMALHLLLLLQIPIDTLFGSASNGVMAKLNVEGQHRGAVAAAKALQEKQEKEHKHHHHHEHKHEHAEDGLKHDGCKVGCGGLGRRGGVCRGRGRSEASHARVEEGWSPAQMCSRASSP